jgi:para-nitrobenzyl esterase
MALRAAVCEILRAVTPTISIRSGTLHGLQIGDVVHFRNVPYAQAQRFAVPEPAPAWQGVRDATKHGPICPQLAARIAVITGEPSAAEQDENCLTLSISTPAAAGPARPVMVWLHGGAYVIGASSYEWYRPDALVREGDVIVVSVNYRLGVFGFLHMPDASVSNLGLLDQIAALRWVQANIAAFGGDASNVTLFGESAGGHSIVALMSAPETRGLFRRAIAQSPHLGVGFMTQPRAARAARAIRRALAGRDPRTASTAELLAAQQRTLIELAGRRGLNSTPAFGPVAGIAPLPQPANTDACAAVVHADVDLLIGSNRDEMRAYFDVNPRIARLRKLPVIGPSIYSSLTRAWTRRVFARPARRLADRHARSGRAAVYLYAFDWAPADAFGACHTIELPFVFGSDAFRGAPMLGRAPELVLIRLGREMRRAWTCFARSGDPNAAGSPAWPRHQPGAGPGRRWI